MKNQYRFNIMNYYPKDAKDEIYACHLFQLSNAYRIPY
jgi:hypothetical protein